MIAVAVNRHVCSLLGARSWVQTVFMLSENEIKYMRYSLILSVDILLRPELSDVSTVDDGLQLMSS